MLRWRIRLPGKHSCVNGSGAYECEQEAGEHNEQSYNAEGKARIEPIENRDGTPHKNCRNKEDGGHQYTQALYQCLTQLDLRLFVHNGGDGGSHAVVNDEQCAS